MILIETLNRHNFEAIVRVQTNVSVCPACAFLIQSNANETGQAGENVFDTLVEFEMRNRRVVSGVQYKLEDIYVKYLTVKLTVWKRVKEPIDW